MAEFLGQRSCYVYAYLYGRGIGGHPSDYSVGGLGLPVWGFQLGRIYTI